MSTAYSGIDPPPPTTSLSDSSSRFVRALVTIRWSIGRLLGWENAGAGLGARVESLRDRLPLDLRAAQPGPYFDALPFDPLYQVHDEFAAEIANRTVHGVLHLGCVAHDDGVHRAELAV